MNIDFGKLRMELIEFEAEELIRYQQVVENFLTREKDVISSHFDKLSESKNEEYNEDYLHVLEDSLAEEYQRFDSNFSNGFRSSVIIRTYSFLEYHLNEFCDDICETRNVKFKSRDLHGNSALDKSKVYLKKACNINFGALNPEWTFIDKVRLLRNSIVHSSGELSLKDDGNDDRKVKTLAIFIREHDSLSMIKYEDKFISGKGGTYQVIIKDEKLNLEFINNVRNLFKKLTRELWESGN